MKLKSIKLIGLALASIISIGSLCVAPTYAVNICDKNVNVSNEVKEAAGCSGTADKLPEVVQNIVSAVIAVSGIVAVIFIVVGGINYMTAAGDSAKVKKAKDTILYASIGLVVCALSFVIVNFVIAKILK